MRQKEAFLKFDMEYLADSHAAFDNHKIGWNQEYFARTDPSDGTASSTLSGTIIGALYMLLLSDKDEAETEE